MSKRVGKDSNLLEVRLSRVMGQAQRYAAHTVDGNELLGYCGRDGVITHPIAGIAKGTRTSIVSVLDPRLSKQGLKRTMATISKLQARPDEIHNPDAPKTADPKWVEINRREVGLYASTKTAVSGTGWESGGYFCIIYEVTEKLAGGVLPEVRVRVAEGRPCRMMGEGYLAFASLFAAYAQHARDHDEGDHVERSHRCFDKIPGTRAMDTTKASTALAEPDITSRKKRARAKA